MEIKLATLKDLKYIESLSKKESKAVGFIPKIRYEAAIIGKRLKEATQPNCNDKLLVCEENGDLVGFVLGTSGNVAKISQICIQEDARLLERGEALLDGFIETVGGLDFSCGCADDLESNKFWKAMGWEKAGQRNGIYYGTSKETSDRIINIYRLQLESLFARDDR